MADYLVTDAELTSIADSIRTKGGTSANLSFPTEFVSAINAIQTGITPTGVKYVYSDIDDDGGVDIADYAILNVDYAPLYDGKTRIWVDIDILTLSTFSFSLQGKTRITNALTIDYGDGTTETISSGGSASITISHQYSASGRYCIEITNNTSDIFYLYNNAFGNSVSDNSRCVLGIEAIQTQATSYPIARYCPNLKAVTIEGDNVTTINGYYFNQSPSVQKIVIPKNVTSIGGSAFSYCTDLKKVTVQATTPPSIQSNTFPSTLPSDCKIRVPSASLSAYQSATNWSTYASQMVGE